MSDDSANPTTDRNAPSVVAARAVVVFEPDTRAMDRAAEEFRRSIVAASREAAEAFVSAVGRGVAESIGRSVEDAIARIGRAADEAARKTPETVAIPAADNGGTDSSGVMEAVLDVARAVEDVSGTVGAILTHLTEGA